MWCVFGVDPVKQLEEFAFEKWPHIVEGRK
jgi:hypothetical protein